MPDGKNCNLERGMRMEEYLKIIQWIMEKSGIEYDMLLLSNLITGLSQNSKYKFPVHDFSEKMCEKYHTKYHKGYFNILHYYEKENAIDLFMEYASSEQIIVEDFEITTDLNNRLIYTLSEIEKRPEMFLGNAAIKNLKSFLDGYLAGEDLTLQKPIGDSMSALEMALDKYFSKKYELYEKKPWYDKLEYMSAGFAGNVRAVITALECLEFH